MGKEEVENYLRDKKRYVSAKQISFQLNKTLSATNRILNSMVSWGEAKCIKKKIRVGNMTRRNVRYFKWRF
jgi:hypothetical protein